MDNLQQVQGRGRVNCQCPVDGVPARDNKHAGNTLLLLDNELVYSSPWKKRNITEKNSGVWLTCQ